MLRNPSTPTKLLGLRVGETCQIASPYVICSAFSAIDIALSALRHDNWVGEIGQRLTSNYREPSVPCGGFRDGLRTALSFSMTNPFPHFGQVRDARTTRCSGDVKTSAVLQ